MIYPGTVEKTNHTYAKMTTSLFLINDDSSARLDLEIIDGICPESGRGECVNNY
jgi:hypothetical protein